MDQDDGAVTAQVTDRRNTAYVLLRTRLRTARVSGHVPASQPTRLDLGAALRRIRIERELTIEAVAFGAGAHHTYVSKIEHAKHNITWEKLGTFADALGVSIVEVARVADEERVARLTRERG